MVACNVRSTSFISCRFAPSTTTAMGMPWPSVSRLRLVPLLPRSVGLGPVPFSPQGSFGHGSVHGLPFPIKAVLGIVLYQSFLPKPLKHPGSPPFLESVMHRAGRSEAPRQSLPLAGGAQHIEDPVHALPGRDTREAFLPSAWGLLLATAARHVATGNQGYASCRLPRWFFPRTSSSSTPI